ncbi:tetratricopeptide repeat protein [Polynucleobacter sp. AP-Sanab-80-C2]|uniref:O-linked N-acetylglucosamine transferase, SPINDLY family protein n=1 Tax=Polynucleobacter sp. AP-Sanab-80-C2 TaxID=3108274 RepID=UPI002B2395E8|nr:tetratricopeptide repeat protein [Polynucleobacter sp. AP-Sanab-80-C2]MEA9598758.1 tetratricopeptide repeat protein [Polynucleobacter sp. AP-Sanab-80-C2]
MSIFEEAKSCFLKGIESLESKSYEQANDYFEKSLRLLPDRVSTITNLSVTKIHLKKLDDAIRLANQSIALDPENFQGYLNLGLIEKERKNFQHAITYFAKAIKINPKYAEGWHNQGVVLNALKRYPEAIIAFEKAHGLNPNFNCLLGTLIETKSTICDWTRFNELTNELNKKIISGGKVTHPFPTLSICSSENLQLKAAKTWVQDQFSFASTTKESFRFRSKNSKIRIGYFSSDLIDHAIAVLTTELFELHDRNVFEVFAFSLSKSDQSAVRKRLEKAFDHFIDCEELDDQAIAQMSNDLKIDIAVDLGGFTNKSRTKVFAFRAAPIQISYLGYLGTMGCNFIDYIIADRIILPRTSYQYYCEKIICLPSYQANTRRVVSDYLFTRKELGLQDSNFVFCCFNNSYKITPTTFDSWIRILKNVESSVLFLYADNEDVKQNLRLEAENRGLDSTRLVFGGRLPKHLYLARFKVCDLFLDTLPYNSGTIASDALWSGLPVLTLSGNTFAGRMCASILNAAHLPELITQTSQEYEDLAIDLARNPQKLSQIKNKLNTNRQSAPLFDTPSFVKNLEEAYKRIYKLSFSDSPLDDILI